MLNCILYADDANIIITGNNQTEVWEHLTKLNDKLVHWVRCSHFILKILNI